MEPLFEYYCGLPVAVRAMKLPPVDEATTRRLLALYRDRERWLTVREMAQRCGINPIVAERIIKKYHAGKIDADGLKTVPLFPEVFRRGYPSAQLCFPF